MYINLSFMFLGLACIAIVLEPEGLVYIRVIFSPSFFKLCAPVKSVYIYDKQDNEYLHRELNPEQLL